MNTPTYPITAAAPLIFTFVSEGKRGRIKKVVRYDMIYKNVFNLGFGDFDQKTLQLNDKADSNNGDIRKVMATVIQTLPLFFEKHPDKVVQFKGSDQRRTLFYSRIIRTYQHEIEDDFQITGKTIEGRFEAIKEESRYEYFIIRKK